MGTAFCAGNTLTDWNNTEDTPDALEDLRRFEARISPDGLFLRYCKTRLRSFGSRLVLTLTGSLFLSLLYNAEFGFNVMLLLLSGEAVDCLTLRFILQRRARGILKASDRTLAKIAAVFQSLTIAACVILTWALVPFVEASFFAAAYLTGAVINAGLVRMHDPAIANLRIWVFAMTATTSVYFVQIHVHAGEGNHSAPMFFFATMLLLAYLCFAFTQFVGQTYAQRMQIEHALLVEKHQLDLSRKTLQKREREARRLALVAEHTTDSVIITDADGRIEWVNDAFTRITGYGFYEALGMNPGDILNVPETDLAAIAALDLPENRQKNRRVEVLNRTKTDGRIWMDVILSPIFNSDGSHAMTIAVERDITEARAREAELSRARQAAEAAAQSKSRFLATMSHEIRTPMNGVIGMADLLSATQLNPVQADYVRWIVESGQALMTIINDILDISKLQSGKPVILAEPFDLHACVGGAMALLQPTAMAKKVGLLLVPMNQDLPRLLGDEGRIRQVLLNLIGNAVKFTAVGDVTVAVSAIRYDTEIALSIAVKDTGIGIPADKISGIFESFTQADDQITRRFGGTGLGLAISQLLAREMGGEIDVTSAFGDGSCFVFSLRLPLAETAVSARKPAEPAMAAPYRGQRILVAEDNKTNSLIVKRMLESEFLTLEFAENGARAVALYQQQPPDLVLMDMSMPVMDGLEATREIRRLEAEQGLARCPVIALTANAFGEDRDACLAAGFDDFLTKPVTRAALTARIGAHLIA